MNQDIPDNIRLLADSVEIFDASEKIGKEFGLHIDQIGQLDSQIRQVLRGFSKSKNFTNDIANNLEISAGLAKKITASVNTEIFQTIKTQLQSETTKTTNNNQQSIADLERLGGFNIEPEQGSDDIGNDHIESKATLINDIENPPSAVAHTEPLVDHLLSKPMVTVEQKTEIPAPKSSDLYREPIE